MNGGTNKGQADGFDITILPQLNTTKNVNNSATLLSFVARVARARIAQAPKLLDEIPTIGDAAREMPLSEVDNKVKRILDDFKAIKETAKGVIAKPISDEDMFATKITAFLENAQTEIDELSALREKTFKAFERTTQWFSASYEAKNSPEFFGIFANFANDFIKALPAASASESKEAKGEAKTAVRRHKIGEKIGGSDGDAMSSVIDAIKSGSKVLKGPAMPDRKPGMPPGPNINDELKNSFGKLRSVRAAAESKDS
eukprot:TRINITY_DN5334_c0_g1_i9.p1 TRINITY_DN5334_c0_g1~~TRINITY_DN5334_c0_g1_i9.p1  ORF type:complete len:257 (+),score=91.31 TRINITY_DN5334_c0_g1_i9:82-852(+)